MITIWTSAKNFRHAHSILCIPPMPFHSDAFWDGLLFFSVIKTDAGWLFLMNKKMSLKRFNCSYLIGFGVVLIKNYIHEYIHAFNTFDCAKKETKSFLSNVLVDIIFLNYVIKTFRLWYCPMASFLKLFVVCESQQVADSCDSFSIS